MKSRPPQLAAAAAKQPQVTNFGTTDATTKVTRHTKCGNMPLSITATVEDCIVVVIVEVKD